MLKTKTSKILTIIMSVGLMFTLVMGALAIDSPTVHFDTKFTDPLVVGNNLVKNGRWSSKKVDLELHSELKKAGVHFTYDKDMDRQFLIVDGLEFDKQYDIGDSQNKAIKFTIHEAAKDIQSGRLVDIIVSVDNLKIKREKSLYNWYVGQGDKYISHLFKIHSGLGIGATDSKTQYNNLQFSYKYSDNGEAYTKSSLHQIVDIDYDVEKVKLNRGTSNNLFTTFSKEDWLLTMDSDGYFYNKLAKDKVYDNDSLKGGFIFSSPDSNFSINGIFRNAYSEFGLTPPKLGGININKTIDN